MTLLVESTIKISCILLVALAATALMRRRSAALRHWVLSAAIICAAAAPVLQRMLPAWHLHGILTARINTQDSLVVSLSNHERLRSSFDTLRTSGGGTATVYAGSKASARASRVSFSSVVTNTWLAGTVVGLLILSAGLGRLASIASRARRIEVGPWTRIADAVSRELGLSRPVRLLQSRHATLLITWGVLRPSIILPPGAQGWSVDRIRIVLYHELAHVRRGDWLFQMVAETVKAACWFNPVVWMACRRLRQESEQAADDAVLCRGIDGPTYATELVGLARSFVRQRHPWLPAPAIARPSSLERRVRAMLSSRINRRPTTRFARIATLAAVAALAVAIASAQGAFSSLSGAVYDPLNGLLPDARMMLTNEQTGAKYEIRSDAGGRFEFVGLPPGRYSLETEREGFRTLRGSVDISGQNVQRNVMLQIGSLEETVSVRVPRPGESARAPTRLSGPRVWTSTTACTPPSTPAGIGGYLTPPTKIGDAAPQYPANLAAAHQGGVVVLDALVGKDGTIRDVRAMSSTHPDFELAAVDAVRQWAFSQTLLNCVPVEVAMKVTVNFIAQ